MTAEWGDRRKCRACGSDLIFARNGKSGKLIPLDVASRAHIYELSDSDVSAGVCHPAGGTQELYLSHFLTCPKASEFSGKGKQGALL